MENGGEVENRLAEERMRQSQMIEAIGESVQGVRSAVRNAVFGIAAVALAFLFISLALRTAELSAKMDQMEGEQKRLWDMIQAQGIAISNLKNKD